MAVIKEVSLQKKIEEKTAIIGIIGLGYVGLPLAIAFAQADFMVMGIEQNPQRMKNVNNGINYIESDDQELKRLIEAKKIKAFSDFSRIGEMDVISICAPTPLNKNREPELKYVIEILKQLVPHLRKGQLIVMESTTYPGTTRDVILPLLLENKDGLKVGEDFFVAYAPERIDPGNKRYKLSNTPRIVGGITQRCALLAKILLEQITSEVYIASSPEVAEMEKLFENIFRSVNIALVNELAILCHKMNIDIWEVISLASTKPYGFMPFYPGPGLGGHCIPIDPFYLTWKAREYDFSTKFIELAGEINTNMPYYIVDLITEALNSKGKCLRGSQIMILGAAYKKDISDTRGSPSINIMKILESKGAEVSYNDPYVASVNLEGKEKISEELYDIRKYDCVVICTDHSCYDYNSIVAEAKLVVDTRNATKARDKSNVFIL